MTSTFQDELGEGDWLGKRESGERRSVGAVVWNVWTSLIFESLLPPTAALCEIAQGLVGTRLLVTR